MFDHGIFSNEISAKVFSNDFINDFISLGKTITNKVRLEIQHELCNPNSALKENFNNYFLDINTVEIHLPIRVGDYTDFYSSKHHAENVGKIFRGNENPLTENWLHMPIGYHGRSSSIVISGTQIQIPQGQIINDEKVVFSESNKIDFELEFATVIGKSNQLGSSVEIDNTEDHIFGFCLLNDWSARDIQSWEYKPLGPFLGKNFATTISPWIVTIEALYPFKVPATKQGEVLPYLKSKQHESFDIQLSVNLNGSEITNTNFSKMYWSVHQQIAHHTINGCNLQVGDLLGSGTISDEHQKGCLLEITHNGTKPIEIQGSKRTFLQSGDQVTLSGFAEKNEIKVGFGSAIGTLKNDR
jgi:fumarylacetoacetase